MANLIPLHHAKCTLIKLNGDYLDCDRPNWGRKFQTFLQSEIQAAYQPYLDKCSQADLNKFAEFNF